MGRLAFTLRGFRSPRHSVMLALGELETRIMEVLWNATELLPVREVCRGLGDRLAYTTVMTTLDRLYKKGLLTRRQAGRAFVYRPRISRDEFKRQIATDVVAELLDRDAEPVVACIVDAVSDHDLELLDELDRMIKQKRRTLARTKK